MPPSPQHMPVIMYYELFAFQSFLINSQFKLIHYVKSIWQEEFEDTQEVIRIRMHKSKARHHNGQKKTDNQRSTNITHKTKDRVTRTPLKTGDELGCPRRVGSSCSTTGTCRVTLVTNPVINVLMRPLWLYHYLWYLVY